MTVTVSQLRQDIYRLLDQAMDTGEPLEIRRKGRILKIVVEPQSTTSKLDQLVPHACIAGDPEALVHSDWSIYWSGGKDLL